MNQSAEVPPEPGNRLPKLKSSDRTPRKKMNRTRSFTDALKEKYCSSETDRPNPCEFVIHIVIRGKPKNNGSTTAELAHLRNVVLSNSRISMGGLPDSGLPSLCPNVTDLDLSSNLLESWAELLPMLSQLPHLKFLNLSRNHITRHKEELWRWSTPLPKVENMVLNSTGVPLREVLALARLMPALRELHICCNYYRDLGSVEVAIQDGALSKLECLRLNENIITSWAEVWKLRNLPCLTQLIMSENPLCDVFYTNECASLDASVCDMDSPDITCHSDGEDSSFGSPHFKYPISKMITKPPDLADQAFTSSVDITSQGCAHKPDPSQPSSSLYSQSDLIQDLLEELITRACQNISLKSSVRLFDQDIGHGEFVSEDTSFNETKDCPQFYLDDSECAVSENTREASGQLEDCSYGVQSSSGTHQCEETTCFGSTKEDPCGQTDVEAAEGEKEENSIPFCNLHTLCLSRTSICELDHINALNLFPSLHSLRIMDIALFNQLHQEDRRKLYVASLPSVKILNGSEVTSTERDKAERHFLRHFVDSEDPLPRYVELERKHGPVQPLCDIDLGARFQTETRLTFLLSGVEQFTETVSMIQPVGKLRNFISKRLAIPRHSFRMFHFSCGSCQGPADFELDELFLDSLPLSRFDFVDGDQVHVEFITDTSESPVLRFSKREIKF